MESVVQAQSRAVRRDPFLISISSFTYWLSLGCMVLGFYGYWIFWKQRIDYIGTIVALLIVWTFAVWSPPHRLDSHGLLRSGKPLIAWFGYLALSALWSPDPRMTLFYTFFGLPIAFIVGYVWARNCTVWQLSAYFALQATILLPIVAFSLLTSGQIYGEDRGSIRSMLAGQMLMALPFLVWRARNDPSLTRYVLIAITALLLTGSGSRSGPAIGLLLLIGSIAFVQRAPRQRIRSLLHATAGILLFVGFAMTIPQVRSGAVSAVTRLLTQEEYVRTESGDKLPGDVVRQMQNVVALQSFLAHPFHGGGYYSVLAITERAGIPVSAHGLPATLFGETGIIGFSIFLWMVARFFSRTAREVRAATNPQLRGFWETCRLTMAGMLLYGMFHQVQHTSPFFVLLAWGYAANYGRQVS